MLKPEAKRNDEDARSERAPRRPVSGTMARVRPPEPTTVDDEDMTRVSSPLRAMSAAAPGPYDDDDESTRQYVDMPTRVMHTPAVEAPSESSATAAEPVSAPESAPASAPVSVPPVSGVVVMPSVLIAESASLKAAALAVPAAPRATMPSATAPRIPAERTPHPLEVDRALLRAITATPARFVMPPVVAIRTPKPSPRMLAVVAGFTMLGMLWVMAVCAMILVLVTR